MALEEELKTYEAHRDDLLANSLNKYVLIHGQEVLEVYSTETDAINEGYRRLGNVPFLVKHLVPTEHPLHFMSGVVVVG